MPKMMKKSGVQLLPKAVKKPVPSRAKSLTGSIPTGGRKVKDYIAKRAEKIASMETKKSSGPSNKRELAGIAASVAGKRASAKQQKKIAQGKKANISKIKQAKSAAQKRTMKSFRGR